MDVRRYTQFFGNLFLFCLVIQSISILLNTYGLKNILPKSLNIYWSIGAGIFGFLFVWSNKERIPKMDYRIWNTERKKNKLEKKRFNKNHPTLSKIPVIGFLYRKWKNEPFLYKLALIGLCLLGGVIYFYDLAYYDWLPDEPNHIRTAKGYLETGKYMGWDFWQNEVKTNYYNRAWPYTWIIAQMIKFFGISELYMRAASAICGLLFILVVYGVSNFFLQNRFAAIVVTFVCIMHPYFIVYFRRVRMYALLAPIFLLLFYLFYKILTVNKKYSISFYEKNDWAKKFLNYDWMLLVGTLILFYFAIEVHLLTYGLLVMLIPLFLYLLFVKKQQRLFPVFLLGLFGIILVKYSAVGVAISRVFTFFEMNQTNYFKVLLEFPYPQYFTISILFIGIILIILGKYQTRQVALYSVLIVTLILYVFIIKYPSHFRYVLHIISIFYILMIGILLKINALFISKAKRYVIPSLIIILSTVNLADNYKWVYRKYPEAQFSSQAYKSIENNIKPQKEAIISLFFESLYMRGKGKEITLIPFPRNRKYKIEDFQTDAEPYEAVWVTWATHKSYHLRPKFIKYISQNCRKYHGYGIDNTLIELYYCQ